MPVVTIDGPSRATKEAKKEIIEKISKVVAEAYDMPVESITVLIHGSQPDNIGVGGQQLSERIK
ncbi:MAG: 4-oxalocrotonate tautomerase [Methanosphaera sp. rholeuAM6]|nr:MAG: 4-oxalocrotonate tautomerase [Methanosphaera sp. rholeuAM6]